MTDKEIFNLAEKTREEKHCVRFDRRYGDCKLKEFPYTRCAMKRTPVCDEWDNLCEGEGYRLGFLDGFNAAMEFIHTKQAEDDRPFSIVWLQENFDWKKFYDEAYDYADITFEDVLVKDGNESGCIDMHYRSSFYFSINKGIDEDEWLVAGDRHFRNDSWFPTIKTRGDFKRLFRVAIGIELPLKNQND